MISWLFFNSSPHRIEFFDLLYPMYILPQLHLFGRRRVESYTHLNLELLTNEFITVLPRIFDQRATMESHFSEHIKNETSRVALNKTTPVCFNE